jgi:hypothetical protein
LGVWEHHSFGKDVELGEAEVEIWRHIQPAVPNADVWVELKDGTGLLRLRLDWTPANSSAGAGLGVSDAASIKTGRARTASLHSKVDSPSRFSLGPLTPKKKDRE